jgi:hypothetical protein
MKSKEEIFVNKIINWHNRNTVFDGSKNYIEYGVALEAMEDFASQCDKWINIKDQIPPDYERVLWIDDRDGFINLGYFVWSQTPVSYVTHWMKLPQKPR